MTGISARISRGILAALCEAEPRGLSLAAVAVYAPGLCGCAMTGPIALRHLSDLERRGLVRREADPLCDDDVTWHVTPEGRAYA